MKRRVLPALFFSLFLLAPAMAQNPDLFPVPAVLGSVPYVRMDSFPDPKLGFGYSFKNNLVTLSLYVYNGGHTTIPAGVASGQLQREFSACVKEVRQGGAGTKLLKEIQGFIGTGARRAFFCHGVFQMSSGEFTGTSHLLICAGPDCFLKGRITVAKSEGDYHTAEQQAALGAVSELFLSWVFDRKGQGK